MQPSDAFIFFTDLDGTLLDHETYSYKAALPALRELKIREIPLVLASSKTAAEIAPLRKELGFEHCQAIVENGSGILPAHENKPTRERSYERLTNAVYNLPVALRSHYAGFNQLTSKQVSDLTGLSLPDAELAKKRDFSEPGIWSGNQIDKETFLKSLTDVGISAQQGGRFLTLSFGGNKANQMENLIDLHMIAKGHKLTSVALGDAPNDIEMLEMADFGFIIPTHGPSKIPPLTGEKTLRIRRADQSGPIGWNQCVLDLIKTNDQRK